MRADFYAKQYIEHFNYRWIELCLVSMNIVTKNRNFQFRVGQNVHPT